MYGQLTQHPCLCNTTWLFGQCELVNTH